MKMLRRVAILVLVASAGCSVLDAERLRKHARADALAKVSSQMDQDALAKTELRVDANPWGEGLLVFNVEPASPADVSIWLYFPDAGWGIRTKPKRDEVYALTPEAAKLTSRVPLLESADEKVLRTSGLAGVSKAEARDRVFRAIKHGTYLRETPVKTEASGD